MHGGQQRLAVGDQQDEADVDQRHRHRQADGDPPAGGVQRAQFTRDGLHGPSSYPTCAGRLRLRRRRNVQRHVKHPRPVARLAPHARRNRHHRAALWDRSRPRARRAGSPAARRLRSARGRTRNSRPSRRPAATAPRRRAWPGSSRTSSWSRPTRRCPTNGAPGATVPIVLRAHSSDAPIVRSKRLISTGGAPSRPEGSEIAISNRCATTPVPQPLSSRCANAMHRNLARMRPHTILTR